MMVAVQGLGFKYDILKQNLFLDDNLTLESCRAKILEATERINMEYSEPSAVALKSNTFTRRNRPICEFCGKPGHTEDRCYSKHPHSAPSNGQAKTAGEPKQDEGQASAPIKLAHSSQCWSV